jgi:predicted RND superfamily exporter protein
MVALKRKLAESIAFKPRLAMAAAIVAALGSVAAIAVRGIGFNGSIETLAISGEELSSYDQARRLFGDDRIIVAALTTADAFAPEFIRKLERLTSKLASLDGVAEVQSLTNIKAARRSEDGIVVDRLIPIAATEEQLREIKSHVTRDPLYSRIYISTDGRTASINVFLEEMDQPRRRALAERVERIVKSEAAGDEVLLAGVPVMEARGIKNMSNDMILFSVAGAALCFAVFYLSFGSLWEALLPLAAILMGLVSSLGLIALVGHKVTITTLSLPTVLIAAGSSYAFHILNQYRISAGAAPDPAQVRAAWLDGLAFISPAILASGMTTMAGFGALASSRIPAVRDMGILQSAGIFFMMAFAIVFIPAALSLRGARPKRSDYAEWLNDPLCNITALILFRQKAILGVTISLTAMLGLGLMRLRVNADYLGLFPSSSETVQSAKKLQERLSGAAVIEVVLSGPEGTFYEPGSLRALASLKEFAMAQPGVGAAISVADIIARLAGLLDPKSKETIPQDRTQIEEIFRQFLAAQGQISHLVSQDASRAVLVLRTTLFSSNEVRALVEQIEAWSRKSLPAGLRAKPTGAAVLLNKASDAVARSQISSLAIALISIYLMMAWLLGSAVAGLAAIIPNLLPIACYFGFLGWARINLDITTSLIATASLGMAVDNAAHMIIRYRRCAMSARDEGWAMWLTMLQTGKPMVIANAMLILAFMIFALSSFAPVRLGGILWALTLTACLLANLLFLPVLIRSGPFSQIGFKPVGEQLRDH